MSNIATPLEAMLVQNRNRNQDRPVFEALKSAEELLKYEEDLKVNGAKRKELSKNLNSCVGSSMKEIMIF